MRTVSKKVSKRLKWCEHVMRRDEEYVRKRAGHDSTEGKEETRIRVELTGL